MNIAETVSFDKAGEAVGQGRNVVRRFFLTLVIILVAILSFGVGRLTSAPRGQGIKIEMDPAISSSLSDEGTHPPPPSSATVYASSKGTKYYYAGCSGLSRVSAANKISFATAHAAEVAGYGLASGCQAP
jgi:hypothetical protein